MKLLRLVTAQSAERRDVWSLCIGNKWKERKTTQQHGQIRLSETIFKIWVKVQAITSLYFTLTIALHSLFCTLLFVFFFFSTQLHLLTNFTCLHFIHSYLPPSLLLSFHTQWLPCAD